MATKGTVIAIAGLPASGKTSHAKSMKKLDPTVILIDDPKDWDHDIKPLLIDKSDHSAPLVIVFTDPFMCFEKYRRVAQERFESLGFEVQWIFFENDTETCLQNDRQRESSRQTTSDISWFSKNYEIPEGATVIPVWKKP